MKKLIHYIPFILGAAGAVAALYFLWYKPKKDKEKAEQAAAQATSDAAVTSSEGYSKIGELLEFTPSNNGLFVIANR